MGLMFGCQPEQPATLTPTNTVEVESTVGLERPPSTPTFSPTAIPTESPTNTAVPTQTKTSPPTETATPVPTLIPTAAPSLPEVSPAVNTWTGIGTAVPSSASIITAENVSALTQVTRWGKGNIRDAIYSPDGEQLYVLAGSELYVYDAQTAKELEFRNYDAYPYAMALSEDGQTLAFVMSNNRIELRDAVTNSFVTAFEPFADVASRIYGLTFDPTGEFLYFNIGDQIVVWNIVLGIPAARLSDFEVDALAFSPRESLVATFSEGDDVVQIWQWQNTDFVLFTELEVPESLDNDYFYFSLAISPDGDYVALGDVHLSIAVWQVDNGQLLHVLNQRKINNQGKRHHTPTLLTGPGRYYISDLQFSSDSQYLAEATGFQKLTLWRMSNGEPLQELMDVGSWVIFRPDIAAVATWNYTLTQWNIEDGSFINILNQHIGSITDLELIPNRGQLAIASADSFIYLRQLNNGGLVISLRASENNYQGYFSPSARAIDVAGNTLVSASNDAYRVWNLNDYSETYSMSPVGEHGAHDMVISHDEKYIFGQEEEFGPSLLMWQSDEEFKLTQTELYVTSDMDSSPTDLLLAATTLTDLFDGDAKLTLWQPDTGVSQELLPDQDVEAQYVNTVGFSPDGRFLGAVTGESDRVLLWEINNLEAEFSHAIDILEPPERPDAITGLAFSPDNQLLAVISKRRIDIYDMNNNQLLHTLPISASDILFSEDGRYLITGHSDGTVRFWMVP